MRRQASLLVGALLLCAFTGACGISEQSNPQAIAPENVPDELLNPNPDASTTVTESGGTVAVSVFFIRRVGDQDRLAEVRRLVPAAAGAGERLNALFSQAPTKAEIERGLSTSIPADTVLRGVTEDEAARELVIDLSDEIFSIEGQELAKAFAQIVWTVSELQGVQQVRFLVDGRPSRASDAEGVEKDGAVTRADYATLAPG